MSSCATARASSTRAATDLDQWKSAHAVDTDARTLEEALVGADVFLGLSAAGALKPEMVEEMAPEPIIFAMANPDPEITPPEAKAARPDAIIATGRSDYPNQVNNVLGFPFIFRGALDVRATAINEEMKIAAAEALAELAREQVPEEVAAAYGGKTPQLRPRLHHPGAVRSAADGGRRRRRSPRRRWTAASRRSRSRTWTPIASSCAPGSTRPSSVLSLAYEAARANPKRVLFAEGEERTCCAPRSPSRRAATARRCWSAARTSTTSCSELGVDDPQDYEVLNSRNSPLVGRAVDYLYEQAAAPRHAPPRDRADGQPGPQHLRRRDARAGRGRRDDHRHHAARSASR